MLRKKNFRPKSAKHKPKFNEYEKRAYENNLDKIKYWGKDYRYYNDLQPFLFFYKYLAKKTDMQEVSKHSNLKVWIPDTVVYNDNWAPFWVYWSDDGYVYKTENFNEKHLHTKMWNPNNLDEVVAVTKFIEFDDDNHMCGQITQAITTQDIYLQLQSYNSSNGRTWAIQRFVKWNGPNAFVWRTAWHKEQPNECWIITNK